MERRRNGGCCSISGEDTNAPAREGVAFPLPRARQILSRRQKIETLSASALAGWAVVVGQKQRTTDTNSAAVVVRGTVRNKRKQERSE